MDRVRILPLAEIEPGMRVAEAVIDDAGRVLLPYGAQLSEVMLAALSRRGIGALCIQPVAEGMPESTEYTRQQVVERLDRLFRHAGDGEATRALYAVILQHNLEREA